MKSLKQLSLLKRLNFLIQLEATGSASSCANRLNISRATFFRYRNLLVDLDAPIEYCSDKESYVYTEKFELNFDGLLF